MNKFFNFRHFQLVQNFFGVCVGFWIFFRNSEFVQALASVRLLGLFRISLMCVWVSEFFFSEFWVRINVNSFQLLGLFQDFFSVCSIFWICFFYLGYFFVFFPWYFDMCYSNMEPFRTPMNSWKSILHWNLPETLSCLWINRYIAYTLIALGTLRKARGYTWYENL